MNTVPRRNSRPSRARGWFAALAAGLVALAAAGCSASAPELRQFESRVRQHGEPDQVGYPTPDGGFILATPSAVRDELRGRDDHLPPEARMSADYRSAPRHTFYYFPEERQVVFEPGRPARSEPLDPKIAAANEEAKRLWDADRAGRERSIQHAREQRRRR